MPWRLRLRFVPLQYYLQIARSLCRDQSYNTLRRKYYCSEMEHGVYSTVKQCASCTRNDNHYCHKQPLQLFPSSVSLDFVAVNNLGPLSKTTLGNQKVLFLIFRYSKLTRANPTSKTNATDIAKVFYRRWIISFVILKYLLTNNGPQFVSKLSPSVCSYLGVEHLITAVYRPLTDGQTERFKQTTVTWLRLYVLEHQRGCDFYVQAFTHTFNTQVHRSTNTSPGSRVLSQQLPGQSLLESMTNKPWSLTEAQSTQVMRTLLHRKSWIYELKLTLICAKTNPDTSLITIAAFAKYLQSQ